MATYRFIPELSWKYESSSGKVWIKYQVFFSPPPPKEVIVTKGELVNNAVNVHLNIHESNLYSDSEPFYVLHPTEISKNLNSVTEIRADLELISKITVVTTLYNAGESSRSVNVTTNNTGVEIIE